VREADGKTARDPTGIDANGLRCTARENVMAESVYKIVEIVGTSPTSWEHAASAAVQRAAQTLRDLRIAEITQQDVVISDGKIEAYRVRLKISFKYED
jgi:flavin-binding protein dodecin